MSLLIGGWEDGKDKAKKEYENIKDTGDASYGDVKSEWDETKKRGGDAYEWSEDTLDKARDKVGEKLQVGGEKMKGEL